MVSAGPSVYLGEWCTRVSAAPRREWRAAQGHNRGHDVALVGHKAQLTCSRDLGVAVVAIAVV